MPVSREELEQRAQLDAVSQPMPVVADTIVKTASRTQLRCSSSDRKAVHVRAVTSDTRGIT